MPHCIVCLCDVEDVLVRADGQTVCQPSVLYRRAADRSLGATRDQIAERYRLAMIGHGLLLARTEPRRPGDSVLPCGWPPDPKLDQAIRIDQEQLVGAVRANEALFRAALHDRPLPPHENRCGMCGKPYVPGDRMHRCLLADIRHKGHLDSFARGETAIIMTADCESCPDCAVLLEQLGATADADE